MSKRTGGNESALAVLRRAAGLVEADLLALDLTGVPGHETGVAHRLAQRLVVLEQRTRDAVTDRAGLAGRAAAGDRDLEVEARQRVGELERLANQHARGLATEVVLDRLAVDRDRALAGLHEDAGR